MKKPLTIILLAFCVCPVIFASPKAQKEPEAASLLNESAYILMVSDRRDNDTVKYDVDYPEITLETLERVFGTFDLRQLKRQELIDVIDSRAIGDTCIAEGVRWALVVITEIKDDEYVWWLSVYDAQDQYFRASDYFSVSLNAQTGFSSKDAIENSIQALADNWHNSVTGRSIRAGQAVSISQDFISSYDGVTVLYGSGKGGFLEAGTIADNKLSAEYFPFPEGLPIYGEATKDHYWPKLFTLPQGITEKPAKLPALQRKTRHSVGIYFEERSFTFPEIRGFEMNIQYRFHVLPDRLFLKADWGVWRSTSYLSGLETALHQELCLGAGVYLQPVTDSKFRVYGGTGFAFVSTKGADTVTIAEPLWAGIEWHFPHYALCAEFRLPSILGYERDTYKNPQTDSGVYAAIGVLIKW
jgi:hypothetical protein